MMQSSSAGVADARDAASDEDLVREVREGSTASFAQLYLRHREAAQLVARRWGAAQDAPDVVQEAFLKILCSLQLEQGPTGRFLPYLLRTVRNESIDRNRRSQRIQPLEHGGCTLVDEESDAVEDPMDAMLDHDLIASAFASLPDRWREILWMTEVEGVPPRVLTAHFDLGANAVAQLAHRAREGMRAAWIRINSEPMAPRACRDARRALLERVGAGDHDAAVEHASGCEQCRPVLFTLERLSDRPRAVLLPALLGSAPVLGGLREIVGLGVAPSTAGAQAGPSITADRSGPATRPRSASSGAGTGSPEGAVLAGAGTTGGWFAAAAISAVVLGGMFLVAHAVGSTRADSTTAEAATTPTSSVSESSFFDPPMSGSRNPLDAAPSSPPAVTASQHDAAAVSPLEAPMAASSPPTSPAVQQDAAETPSSSESSSREPGPSRPDRHKTEPAQRSTQASRTPGSPSSASTGATTIDAPSPTVAAPASATDAPIESSTAKAESPADNEPGGSDVPSATSPTAPPTTTSTAPPTSATPRPDAPTIDGPSGSRTVLARTRITGTGQPDAHITLRDQSDTAVASGTVGDDGTWAVTPEPPPAGTQTSYTAVLEVDGATSVPSKPSATFTYDAPNIRSPSDHSAIDTHARCRDQSVRKTPVLFEASMKSDEPYSVVVDGTEHLREGSAAGTDRAWLCFASGEHTIGIAYRDPSTGALGAIRSTKFRVV